MDDKLRPISNAGLNSLSGFAFQMKIFVYLLVCASSGEQVEFETLDDITVRNAADLSCEDNYLKKRKAGTEITVFQVKQTDIGLETSRKVLYNWLLAFNHDSCVTKFMLYVDKGYSARMPVFDHSATDEFQQIQATEKGPTSLIGKIKALYKDREEEFIQHFQLLKSRHQIISIDCDNELSHSLADVFHSGARTIGPTFLEQRINALLSRFCSRILCNAKNRQPYICTKEEYMQFCEEICKEIAPGRYNPNYEDFRQLHQKNELTPEIKTSREYIQLTHCNLTEQKILDHLLWEQYYSDFKQHLLRDAQSSTIASAEDVGINNYEDVVEMLKLENKDSPPFRLLKTKAKPISTLQEEHIRWGAYIYLTGDTAEAKISWKDDDVNDEHSQSEP